VKAVRLFEFDQPPRLVDVAEPRITGPLDVIVRVAGAGVCRTDLHLVEGVFKAGMASKMPFTLSVNTTSSAISSAPTATWPSSWS